MQRGEVWFAVTPGGDRPVLVLTRDPVANRSGSVVVAALTRTRRGLVSELALTAAADGLPSDCVVNFDNIHTIRRQAFRRRVAKLSPQRIEERCPTGRYPAILIRTPYGRNRLTGIPMVAQAKLFARMGYAVALQDVRGRFDSQMSPSYCIRWPITSNRTRRYGCCSREGLFPRLRPQLGARRPVFTSRRGSTGSRGYRLGR